MSKGFKLFLGFLSFWPFLYFLIFLAGMFSLMLFGILSKNHVPQFPVFSFFAVLVVFHFLTIIDIVSLLVYYTVHLFKNSSIPEERKALWAVVLFLGNVFAFPFYWYLYIFREKVPNKEMEAVSE